MWPSGDWSYPDPLQQPGAAPDAAPFHVCRFNEAWLAVIVGSLERLKVAEFWDGDSETIAETLQQIDECLNQLATEYNPPTMTLPVGMISPYSGPTAPEGWLICDGSAVSRAAYPDLFAVCGTTYGAGDGTTTFNLPDLAGRVPSGAPEVATGTGTSQSLGTKFGYASYTLAPDQIPPHSHSYSRANTTTPGGPITGSGRYVTSVSTVETGVYGGSGGATTPHSVVQPSLAVNFIIRATP